MKNVFYKDSIKMYKNNLSRLISIIVIIVLGTSFFIGMNSVSPAMENVANDYMKEKNVYDIELKSNLGYTKDDIEEISKLDFIQNIYGVKIYDALAKFKDKDLTSRIISINDSININNTDIYEGRKVEKNNECLVCSRLCDMYEYKIGQKIKFFRNEDSKIEENLQETEFEIVGIIRNPIFISKFYGNTKLLTGDLNTYIMVNEDVFKDNNYTSLYIKTDIDNNINKFSDEFEEELKERNEKIKEKNEQIAKEKYDKIYKDSQKEILNGEKKIENAIKKIEESNNEIKDAQININNQISVITEKIAQFYNVDTLFNRIVDKKIQIENLYENLKNIEKENYELEKSVSDLKMKRNKLVQAIEELENNIDKNLYEIYSLENEESKFIEKSKETSDMYYRFNKQKEEFEKIDSEYQEKSKIFQNNITEVSNIKNNLKELQRDLYNSFASTNDLFLAINNPEINYQVNLINEAKEQIIKSEERINNSNIEEKISNYKIELNNKKEELNQFKIITDEIPLYKNSGFKSLKDDLSKIVTMGKIFPVMFFIVAALVTITTITRMIDENRKEIGTLKALGYSNKKIMNKYLIYALFAGICGLLIGMIIGSSVIVKILFVSYCSLYDLPNLKFSINIEYTLIALLISLISTVFVTDIITKVSLKENTASLMRPKIGKEGKNILLEKIPFIWKHFSFLTKICFRNIFRYKKRFLMTLIGIAGCTALIYIGLTLRTSINGIGNKQFDNVRKVDMEIYLQREFKTNEVEEIEEDITSKNYIEEVMPINQGSLTIEVNDNSKDIFYIVADQDMNKYIGLQERKNNEEIEFNDDGIIITEKLSHIFKIKKGDKIKIIDEGVSTSVKIIGITENYLYNYVYMTPKMYERIYGTEIKYNSLFVNLKEEISKDEEIKLADKLKENEKIISVILEKNLKEEFLTSLGSLMTIVILFIGCASLLSFTVLINLNNINIEERIRELATLKVLGFYKNELESYVFRENIILTILGTICGLILGMGLLKVVVQSAEVETIFLSKEINIINLVIASIITIIFTLITNIAMKNKLKNINMIDSLKSVE